VCVPQFDDTAVSAAPVEEVWKLLYDPARFPEWWRGVETVQPHAHEGRGDFTMFPDGYPDFPMPQELRSDLSGRSVTVSCLVSDLVFAYRLTPLGEGDCTEIAVHVELPEEEAHRLETQRAVVRASLEALATLATA
jgi:uncharacterized protein YndB with AHSA1/START domain